jgi:hypothetical protein
VQQLLAINQPHTQAAIWLRQGLGPEKGGGTVPVFAVPTGGGRQKLGCQTRRGKRFKLYGLSRSFPQSFNTPPSFRNNARKTVSGDTTRSRNGSPIPAIPLISFAWHALQGVSDLGIRPRPRQLPNGPILLSPIPINGNRLRLAALPQPSGRIEIR